MKAALTRWLLSRRGMRWAWSRFRRAQLHREYVARREAYAAEAEARGIVYHEGDSVAAARARIQGRGWVTTPRRPGEVHTYAFVPSIGWHTHLLTDLRELGTVTLFDYIDHGYGAGDFYPPRRTTDESRRNMNEKALQALKEAHARRPVDWVFVYATGGEITPWLLRSITDQLGIPTVSMFLDDKHGWQGSWTGSQWSGQVDIAPWFDLSWTSARAACEWYLVEGGRPVYLPEGFDAATFHPRPGPKDIPVSFVGSAYGFRIEVVEKLRRQGIDIRTFGSGWPGSGWVSDLSEVIRRSQINLGMGGIGYSSSLVNLKGRDFEIPATGGGVYLTTYNPDLAQHFLIGYEILCYGSHEQMVELIRYYLARPDEADAIAERARERCVREHRWLHRFTRICQMIGVLQDAPA